MFDFRRGVDDDAPVTGDPLFYPRQETNRMNAAEITAAGLDTQWVRAILEASETVNAARETGKTPGQMIEAATETAFQVLHGRKDAADEAAWIGVRVYNIFIPRPVSKPTAQKGYLSNTCGECGAASGLGCRPGCSQG